MELEEYQYGDNQQTLSWGLLLICWVQPSKEWLSKTITVITLLRWLTLLSGSHSGIRLTNLMTWIWKLLNNKVQPTQCHLSFLFMSKLPFSRWMWLSLTQYDHSHFRLPKYSSMPLIMGNKLLFTPVMHTQMPLHFFRPQSLCVAPFIGAHTREPIQTFYLPQKTSVSSYCFIGLPC